jgi:hypothetical protein
MIEPKKLSHLERIRARLCERGSISRNECISTFPATTRLGAHIDDLEKEGDAFEHEHGDYLYRLVSALASKRLTSLISRPVVPASVAVPAAAKQQKKN